MTSQHPLAPIWPCVRHNGSLRRIEERLNAERRRESALTSQHTALLQERSMRAERAASVEGEIAAFEAQVERLTTEVIGAPGIPRHGR